MPRSKENLTADLPRTAKLSFSESLARLSRDELTDSGIILSIDDTVHSHVDPEDPSFLLYDYTNRIAALLATVLTSGPAKALHLGAGGLTIPRWIEHYFSPADAHSAAVAQTVVDIEPELMPFVLHWLPMKRGIRQVIADAAEVLGEGGELHAETFDVVIVDLFNSDQAPEALVSSSFVETVCAALNPADGLLIINFGDDADMGFARRFTAGCIDAADRVWGKACMDESTHHVWHRCVLSAAADVIAARAPGNLVFAATPRGSFNDEDIDALWAQGPHPAEVLCGDELRDWVTG